MKDFRKQVIRARKKIDAMSILVDKAEELGRLPMKSDFTSEEVYTVKNMLGPLPRALEAAGLKEVSERYRRKMEKKGKRIKPVLEDIPEEESGSE